MREILIKFPKCEKVREIRILPVVIITIFTIIVILVSRVTRYSDDKVPIEVTFYIQFISGDSLKLGFEVVSISR